MLHEADAIVFTCFRCTSSPSFYSKAGAPRTEHYQLVRALSADAVVTVL